MKTLTERGLRLPHAVELAKAYERLTPLEAVKAKEPTADAPAKGGKSVESVKTAAPARPPVVAQRNALSWLKTAGPDALKRRND